MTTSFDHENCEDNLTPEQMIQADALEAALDRRRTGAAGSLDPATGDSEQLAELVGRIRGAYEAEGSTSGSEAFRSRRVAQRVLARTTREDLGRRGDVGVVLGFVSDRLRDSAVLRVAAALLIVQLTLVPLVAWQVWKAPHSGIFQAHLEPTDEELARFLEDLPADDAISELGTEPSGSRLDLELGRLALEDSLVETRARLEAMSATLADVVPTSSVGQWLRAMTDLAVPDESTSALAGLEAPMAPLAALLAAEARLNHLTAGGGWAELPEALEEVAESSVEARPLASLRARTMRRAELLGVALPAAGESLIEQTGDGWQRGSEAWLEAIGAAATAVEPSDPYVAAWIAAIVQDS